MTTEIDASSPEHNNAEHRKATEETLECHDALWPSWRCAPSPSLLLQYARRFCPTQPRRPTLPAVQTGATEVSLFTESGLASAIGAAQSKHSEIEARPECWKQAVARTSLRSIGIVESPRAAGHHHGRSDCAGLESSCNALDDEERGRLAYRLTQCHMASLGEALGECTAPALHECTSKLSERAITAFTVFMPTVEQVSP